MAEHDHPAASESKPRVTSDSFPGSQNQETGWSATLKALFWFLIAPILCCFFSNGGCKYSWREELLSEAQRRDAIRLLFSGGA